MFKKKKFVVTAPGMIANPRSITNDDGSVKFLWDTPFDKGTKNPEYILFPMVIKNFV